ncbi:hypothetical protein Clacol_009594 [Clathrus columnatus]|uniref:MFS general substrate transporter n=1 Tax=Clathrus columnatus TaxID=1419009 RepID=A0AAV5AP90_9AGAM|nr:hypothetical protein Clacol_009594 [Clathrus columnatus]
MSSSLEAPEYLISSPVEETTYLLEQTLLQEEMEQEQAEEAEIASRSFLRRPAPWWIWFLVFVAGIAVAATMAPLLDIYTALVCEELKPELVTSTAVQFMNGSQWATIPIPSKMCRQDPAVQSAVAGLVTAMDISMGILSCLTVGYWMQLSDRVGRVNILLVAAFGLIANHVIIVFVSIMPDKLPGGYRFYLFGQIFEGLLGGRVMLSSILAVYITDTSPLDLRTVNLGISAGLDMLGNSLGPSFGAYLIRKSDDLLSVFYFAIEVYAVLTLITIFLVPEALTKIKLKQAKRIYALTHKSTISEGQRLSTTEKVKGKAKDYIRMLNVPFEALEIFLPHRPRDGQTGAALVSPWDLSLFYLGCASFFESIAGNYTKYLFQYLQRVLGWDSQDVGFDVTSVGFMVNPHPQTSIWLGYINAVRAVVLIIILPLFIRWLKSRLGTNHSSSTTTTTTTHATSPSLDRPLRLDYLIVIASMTILVISIFGLSIVRDPIGWYSVTILRTFSGGYEAALRSLALSLYARQVGQNSENGKLLGGLSVLGLISGNMIGPAIFGSLYIHTVEDFPQYPGIGDAFLDLQAMLITAAVLGCTRQQAKRSSETTAIFIKLSLQ